MHGTTSDVAVPVGPAEFRAAAAETSEGAAREQGAACGLDSAASLCLRQPGDPTPGLYRIAVVPWVLIVFGLLLFLFGVVLAILILTPWVDANVRSVGAAAAAIIIGPVVLVWAGASDATRNRTLARRLGAR